MTRALLTDASLSAYNDVKTAILAEGPHVGSGSALVGSRIWPNYGQLYPLWPWTRTTKRRYILPSGYENVTLSNLNRRFHNPKTMYVLCYGLIPSSTVIEGSSSIDSPRDAALVFADPILSALHPQTKADPRAEFGNGDLYVPTFSQRGRMYDPSTKVETLIPAFAQLTAVGRLRERSLGATKHVECEGSKALYDVVDELCAKPNGE